MSLAFMTISLTTNRSKWSVQTPPEWNPSQGKQYVASVRATLVIYLLK